ncbi:hypothetical protein F4553_006194 [Allocatelliglobosispora scoriae]|uniref:Roadblock/LAMTOR2 domain-containing protein n=1 Tax=Allocatelliglobosispora scoriae TaxID=643052 RepID=A0A841C1B4_9ACTN|nr:hypothetical protein [Allocatelliglobosispora scoriae]MBB5872760.1 hypothetical protein [Allocatelliglobosispora scoriae]
MAGVDECLRRLMALQGVLGAGLIDFPTGSSLGTAGRGHDRSYAEDAAEMIHATLRTAAFATVGDPGAVEDVVITAANGYHLLRPLPAATVARVVIYLWLDRTTGNLAVTQRQLTAIAAEFSAN